MSSSGKRLRSLSRALLAASCLTWPGHQAFAQVVPANGSTQVFNAPNGVPVVNIATANSGGLSHNKFFNYNVDSRGLVLNNGNTSQLARQSQLAGQVVANTNLTNEASVILNEVVAANRSTLAGYTEVLGGKADVVVANPWGITCSGCGFINSGNVTLTTGTPNINGSGTLTGFTVSQGDVLVNGNGLDATNQGYFAIVTRSVKFDGQVNAHTLDVVTGPNVWDYSAHTATAQSATGTAPSYAIDSTALGGMYADRIRFIATENGVGVRQLANVAATGDDFTINAAGQVQINSQVSAARDLSITSTSNSGTAINTTDATLTSTRDLSLTASSGGISNAGGVIKAGRNLAITAASYADTSTTTSITNDNQRYAAGTLNFVVTNSATLNGVDYGSGGIWTGSFGSLTAQGASQLYSADTLTATATNGNMSLNDTAVKSTNALTLQATTGTISNTAGSSQGFESTAGNVVLSAGTNVANSGTITSDTGTVTLNVAGTLTNNSGGVIHSKTAMLVQGFNGTSGTGSATGLTNSGKIISEDAATINVATVTNNNGATIQSTKATTLTATTLTNSGNLIASTNNAYSGTFNFSSFTNNTTGVLQSALNLNLNGLNTLANSGKIIAPNNLTIRGTSAGTNLAVTNAATGVMQATATLDIQGYNAGSALTFNTQAGNVLANQIILQAQSLTNTGTIEAQTGANTFTIIGTLANNSGGLFIASTTSGSNTGTGTITAGSLTNAGTLQSAGALGLNVTNALGNSGSILGTVGVTIRGTTSSTNLAVTNSAGGKIQSGTTLDIQGYNAGSALTFNTQAGNVLANQIILQGQSLTNTGTIEAQTGASTFTIVGTLANNSGGSLIGSTTNAGTVTVNAGTFNNAGIFQAAGLANVNIGSTYTNSGTTTITGILTVRGESSSTYSVSDSGTIQSASTLDIKGYNAGNAVNISTTATNASLLGNVVNFNVNTLSLNDGSGMTSTGNMTINAQTISFGGSGAYIVAVNGGAGLGTITVANALSNNAAIASQYDLTLNTAALTNTSTGGIFATHNLIINASGDISNSGALYSGNDMTVTANSNTFTNVSANGTVNVSHNMTFNVLNFTNNNYIAGTNNITINATTFRNEVAGGAPTRVLSGTKNSDNTSSTFEDDTDILGDGYQEMHYTETWYQLYQFATTPSTVKANLLANGTITVNFTNGYNTASIISAPTLNLNGTGTFTNDDLSLTRVNYTRLYTTQHHCVLGICGGYGPPISDSTSSTAQLESNSENPYSGTAGLYAGTLNASGFSLVNTGSPLTTLQSSTSTSNASITSSSKSGASSSNAAATALSASTLASGVAAVSPTGTVVFAGLVINLPTNPNGYFVLTHGTGAKYLVETNPRFAVGSNFVGSDYLAQLLGVNPDTEERRLGDAAYENYLVQQQLESQLGRNMINLASTENDQMKNLMTNGADEAKKLGLQYGQAPTPQQLANLTEDMVWMVSTVVDGQTVLTPVVYLSEKTKDSLSTGATIASNDANMNLTSLTNTGGTIQANNNLNVTTKDDITNTSGTIEGGNVNLKSTQGSIVNKTLDDVSGTDGNQKTTIGKTGTITATNNLSMDAKKNITNLGADVNAGGNANLKAGGNVTFDTIQDKESSTSYSSTNNLFSQSSTTTVTSSTTQVHSGLNVGGNLDVTAGKDVTLAGTDTKTGGDATLNAGNNVNILDRQNTSSTVSHTSSSGIGVGGGIWGDQTVDDTTNHSHSTGSAVNAGGNLNVNAGNDLNVRGSTVNAGKDVNVNATDVNVLAGTNTDTHTTKTTTTTIGIDVDTSGGTGVQKSTGINNAGASADANGEVDVNFMKTNTTVDSTADVTHNASSLGAGGNLNINAKNNLKTVGSDLSAGGNANVNATNMDFEAAQDTHDHSHSSDTTTVGLYASGDASAQAQAGTGNAVMSATGEGSVSANASAGLRTAHSSDVSTDGTSTARVSTITAGGNINRTAKGDITDVGTSINAGGDLNQSSTTYTSKAAQNTSYSTDTSTQDVAKVGAYVEGSAGASGSVQRSNGVNGSDSSSDAGGSFGLQASYSHDGSTSSDQTSTAVVGNIKTGHNANITTTGNTTLEGTNISSGGDTNLTAGSLDYKAAANTETASGNSLHVDATVQVAEDAFSANGAVGTSKANATSSNAVTGSLSSGGNINIKTTKGDANFTGTNMDTSSNKGSVNIDSAGAVNMNAAHNTYSSSDSDLSVTAGVSVGSGKEGKSGGVNASFSKSDSSFNSDEETAGSISTGSGNLNIKSGKSTTFEGTQMNVGGDANVDAKGAVNFNAATSTQSGSSFNVGADVGASGTSSKNKGEEGTHTVTAGFNVGKEDTSAQTQQGASLTTGGKLSVNSGSDVNLQGTTLQGGTGTNIDAKGKVNQTDIHNTSSDTGFSVGLSVTNQTRQNAPSKGGKGKTGKSGENGEENVPANEEGTANKPNESNTNAGHKPQETSPGEEGSTNKPNTSNTQAGHNKPEDVPADEEGTTNKPNSSDTHGSGKPSKTASDTHGPKGPQSSGEQAQSPKGESENTGSEGPKGPKASGEQAQKPEGKENEEPKGGSEQTASTGGDASKTAKDNKKKKPADPLPVQKAIVNLEADGASNQNAQEKTNVQDSQVHSGDLIKRPDAIGPSTSTEKTEQNAAGAAVGLGVGIGINSALDDGKSKNQNQVSVTGSVTDVHKDESQGTKIGGSSVNIQQGGQ